MQYWEAVCAYKQRCASDRGRDYSSEAACLETLTLHDTLLKALNDGVGYFDSLELHNQLADAAAATRCIDGFATLSCTATLLESADCKAAMEVSDPVAADGVCDGEALLCQDDVKVCTLKSGTNSCYQCKDRRGNGELCDAHEACQSGYCGFSNNNYYCLDPSAVTLKAKGVQCAVSAECLGELICARSGNVLTCQERGGVGAVCDPPNTAPENRGLPPCATDLDCVISNNTAQCQARLPDGQQCSRPTEVTFAGGAFDVVLRSPACKNLCVYGAADAATGTCGSPASLPAANSPCASIRGNFGLYCDGVTDGYPDYTFNGVDSTYHISACTCAVKTGLNQSCWYNDQCKDSRCQGTNFDVANLASGTCQALLADATACSRDDDCLNGVCYCSDGVCANDSPQPVCSGPRGNNNQFCDADADCISGYCNFTVNPAVCAGALSCP